MPRGKAIKKAKGIENEIRDAVIKLIDELCLANDILLDVVRTLHDKERTSAPTLRFLTTGKRGGSPGICLHRTTVFCWDGVLALSNNVANRVEFDLADPQFPDTVLEHLKKVLRV